MGRRANPSVETTAARPVDIAQYWGEPPPLLSAGLSKSVRELQAELVGLATDMRRGPLTRVLTEANVYLSELRREFLRVHRRLVVSARNGGQELKLEVFRTELAELNERLRSVVLGRASRMSTEGWRPSKLLEALERTTEVLPARIEAELEPMSLQTKATDPFFLGLSRAFVRGSVRVQRAVGAHPRRTVELQALARFHLSGMTIERFEGIAAMFVQAEAQLVNHSRLILAGISRGLDTVREHADADDLLDVLATFKQQVEEEFMLAETEIARLVDDGGRRVVKVLGEGLRGLKADLPIAGTFELPSRKRRHQRVLSAQSLALEDLEGRLARTRQSLAASYVLLGLHLEYASYRARVRVVMGRQVTELKKDVRGRSHTQIERVLAAVDEALAALVPESEGSEGSAPAEETPPEVDLRGALEPLERVLTEAVRNANQLLEQLSEEQLVAPLLEALNREAQGLTDRYEVPAGKLPYAEWRLPPPLATVEVRLVEMLTAYIQTNIAPELLRVTQAAVSGIQPVVSAFHDLERVVRIDTEAYAEDFDMAPDAEDAVLDPHSIAVAALTRSRGALEEALGRSDKWPDTLAENLKQVVFTSVDALRESISEAQVGRLRSGRARGPAGQDALQRQVDRLAGVLNRIGDESTQRVRALLGERRLQAWRRQLGLREPAAPSGDVAARLAPPSPSTELPLFYRRLFASNAYWASDLLPEQRSAVERVKGALGRGRGRGLRTAVVVSPDGAAQGALLTALSRGDRFSSVRRVTFSAPASVAEVEEAFEGLGRGQLLIVSGFHWLFGAGPRGFAPLRAFLAGVLADGGKNAWVVEASRLVWRYACKVAPAAEVFADRIEVGPLALDDLEAALWSRHQLSGLSARFSDEAAESNAEQAARERYFARLHAVSGGLLALALPAWVASIRAVDEAAAEVRLEDPPPSPRAALDQLSEDDALLVFTVMRQGWMDAETLAYLFSLSTIEAQGRLMRLVADGVLEQKGREHFQVRRHLRYMMQTVLRERGLCR